MCNSGLTPERVRNNNNVGEANLANDGVMVLRGEARVALTNLRSETYYAELAFAQKRYDDVLQHLINAIEHVTEMAGKVVMLVE